MIIIVYIASCKVVEVSGFGLVRALLSALGTGCVVFEDTLGCSLELYTQAPLNVKFELPKLQSCDNR